MFTLRTVLRLDAAASGGLGLLLLVLAGPAEDHLGLPVGLALVVGALLLAWAGFVGWVSVRPSRGLVREIALLNLAYVALSVAFALGDWATLTTLGTVLVVVQAVAVLGLAAAQLALLPVGDRAPTTA